MLRRRRGGGTAAPYMGRELVPPTYRASVPSDSLNTAIVRKPMSRATNLPGASGMGTSWGDWNTRSQVLVSGVQRQISAWSGRSRQSCVQSALGSGGGYRKLIGGKALTNAATDQQSQARLVPT